MFAVNSFANLTKTHQFLIVLAGVLLFLTCFFALVGWLVKKNGRDDEYIVTKTVYEKLEKKMDDRLDQIDKKTSENQENLNKAIDGINSKINQSNDDTNSKIDKMSGDISDKLSESLNNNKQQIDDMNDKISKMSETIGGLNDQLTQVNNKIKDVDDNLKEEAKRNKNRFKESKKYYDNIKNQSSSANDDNDLYTLNLQNAYDAFCDTMDYIKKSVFARAQDMEPISIKEIFTSKFSSQMDYFNLDKNEFYNDLVSLTIDGLINNIVKNKADIEREYGEIKAAKEAEPQEDAEEENEEEKRDFSEIEEVEKIFDFFDKLPKNLLPDEDAADVKENIIAAMFNKSDGKLYNKSTLKAKLTSFYKKFSKKYKPEIPKYKSTFPQSLYNRNFQGINGTYVDPRFNLNLRNGLYH